LGTGPTADVVLIQRKLLPRWQLQLVRWKSPMLLYDFDDAVFVRDSYSRKGLHSKSRLRRFQATVRAVDGVLAGNAFLQRQAREAGATGLVEVVPTCVDPESYPIAEHRRAGEGVQLVWIGSSSTLHGLEKTRDLLENIGAHCPGLNLKLICDRFLRLAKMHVLDCPWKESREAIDLATADIGISWLPDDPWSSGKCGLKVLQYMAAGLPVVANRVGVQAGLVSHGKTGFLATTPSEWVQAINRLAHDPGLRRQMGQAGRRRVQREFSLAAGAACWIGLLDQLQRRRTAA
jgi:glycosyltransferase involved in cell wall biosynthesis